MNYIPTNASCRDYHNAKKAVHALTINRISSFREDMWPHLWEDAISPEFLSAAETHLDCRMRFFSLRDTSEAADFVALCSTESSRDFKGISKLFVDRCPLLFLCQLVGAVLVSERTM